MDPNKNGRNGGRGAESEMMTALPLEVPWAETALWALSGLTDGSQVGAFDGRHVGSFDGRHVVRTGLLERSGLGVARVA